MFFPQTCSMLKASSIQEAFQMNQTAIGSYIARKRKEQNLTQEQLERQKGILYGVPSSPSIFPAAPCRRQPGIPMCAILSQAS